MGISALVNQAMSPDVVATIQDMLERRADGLYGLHDVTQREHALQSAWLAERDYALVATTPDTDVLHTDSDLTGAIAVAVGTEKYGLDEELFAASTLRVRIPMAGQADSLNAATAAAIVLFEAVRQRG